jgi:hypothetical protein
MIILDKSVVFGLNNFEIDSLDRYFFQIVPPILTNEILADLSKETQKPSITDKIASHSYRISGNRGLPMKYQTIFENSLVIIYLTQHLLFLISVKIYTESV